MKAPGREKTATRLPLKYSSDVTSFLRSRFEFGFGLGFGLGLGFGFGFGLGSGFMRRGVASCVAGAAPRSQERLLNMLALPIKRVVALFVSAHASLEGDRGEDLALLPHEVPHRV